MRAFWGALIMLLIVPAKEPIARADSPCRPGYQRVKDFGDACLTDVMVGFIVCLRQFGGGKAEISVKDSGGEPTKVHVEVKGEGKSLIAGGSGSVKVDTSSDKTFIEDIVTKFNTEVAKSCERVATQPGQPGQPGGTEGRGKNGNEGKGQGGKGGKGHQTKKTKGVTAVPASRSLYVAGCTFKLTESPRTPGQELGSYKCEHMNPAYQIQGKVEGLQRFQSIYIDGRDLLETMWTLKLNDKVLSGLPAAEQKFGGRVFLEVQGANIRNGIGELTLTLNKCHWKNLRGGPDDTDGACRLSDGQVTISSMKPQ